MKNQSQPLVSVIIPTYNSATTLGACLKSVKAQTYKNVEVILESDEKPIVSEKFVGVQQVEA